jgi:carbamoyltransferase
VMGLAPYGDPERHLERMRELVRLDGLFELGLDYFFHPREGVDLTWAEGTPTIGRLYSARLVDAFGEPRQDEDVAAALQAVLEEAYLHLVGTLQRRTGLSNICLAGGVALNAVANGRIRPETGFDGIYVQPAAGDSGTSVGAAYWVWNQHLGRPRSFVMEHAYTGPEYSEEECAHVARGLDPARLADDELFPEVARRIADGEVVGWFQGRMEFGPRALGNRSIVVDPRRADMKDVLNARIKHREPFRPFAPSILAEATGEWFEQDYSSPFMVLVYKTRTEKRAEIPAVNHVDDTGRLQTVEERVAPRYHRLISEFARLTGVPVLLNTSFNENEPIVMSPEHAVETFTKTQMDALVLGNFLISRSGT